MACEGWVLLNTEASNNKSTESSQTETEQHTGKDGRRRNGKNDYIRRNPRDAENNDEEIRQADVIEYRITVVEEDLKDVKDSIEYAHAEMKELKTKKQRNYWTKSRMKMPQSTTVSLI